jgi:hypothetical protein
MKYVIYPLCLEVRRLKDVVHLEVRRLRNVVHLEVRRLKMSFTWKLDVEKLLLYSGLN